MAKATFDYEVTLRDYATCGITGEPVDLLVARRFALDAAHSKVANACSDRFFVVLDEGCELVATSFGVDWEPGEVRRLTVRCREKALLQALVEDMRTEKNRATVLQKGDV